MLHAILTEKHGQISTYTKVTLLQILHQFIHYFHSHIIYSIVSFFFFLNCDIESSMEKNKNYSSKSASRNKR